MYRLCKRTIMELQSIENADCLTQMSEQYSVRNIQKADTFMMCSQRYATDDFSPYCEAPKKMYLHQKDRCTL